MLKAGSVTNSTVSILKSGDWTFTSSSGAFFGVATNSTVVFTNESGIVNASGGPGEIGKETRSYAKVVNQSGNWTFKTYLTMAGGAESTGIVEKVSGDWSVGSDMRVASSGYGEFTQYGGSLTVGGNMYISYWGSGNGGLTIKGGTVTVPSTKNVMFRTGTGTINLDGGTLVTKQIYRGTGNGTLIQNINFNGGTLKANAAYADPFIYGPSGYMYVTVNAGGGTIDCNGYPITLDLNATKNNVESCTIKGEGGLTFTGGNTITINSPVTYAGVTRVTPGTTLAVANEIAKNNILANGLVVIGVPTAGQTVFTYTNALDNADLANVSCPCVPETTFRFSDEGKTNIVVDVVGSSLDWTKYSHKFKVSFSGYAGSETLTDFPVLVKISESGISGFRYADCKRPSDADWRFVDLRFADESGNLLASEVDTWNPTGESLVWVKVPSLTAATKITAYYGWDLAPVVDDPKAVWSNGYVGVWHLNEASTPLAESSGMSTPFVLPASTQDRTTYEADGVAGGKAVSFDNERYSDLHARLEVADDPDLRGLTNFTVECWTYQTRYRGAGENDANIIGNWLNWRLYQEATGAVVCRWQLFNDEGTTSNSVFSAKSPALPLNEWTHTTFVRNFTGESSANGTMYLNGGSVATKAESNAKATGSGSEVNHNLGSGGGVRVFPGSIDEVRVSNVARSADWVKASHDTVTESSFATYGPAGENVATGIMIIIE